MTHWRRLGGAILALLLVIVIGTTGYLALGFSPLNALYQTVTTVSTVGFREVEPLSTAGKVFTMALILVGVGAAFYAFGVLIETFIEGRLNELFGRRRMEQSLASMQDHVIVCGWGRVGRSLASEVEAAGRSVLVVDREGDSLPPPPSLSIQGDATEDAVLRAAGIDRAAALVAAVDSDSANSFIVLGARAMRPDLFIVARARSEGSVQKLRRAGADRVVNPQVIGGARMAAFVLRPHVAEFLDVAMHERDLQFRLEEFLVPADSPVVGRSVRAAGIREETGSLVLALRDLDGSFLTNPSPDLQIAPGQVIIAIGTQAELTALGRYVGGAQVG